MLKYANTGGRSTSGFPSYVVITHTAWRVGRPMRTHGRRDEWLIGSGAPFCRRRQDLVGYVLLAAGGASSTADAASRQVFLSQRTVLVQVELEDVHVSASLLTLFLLIVEVVEDGLRRAVHALGLADFRGVYQALEGLTDDGVRARRRP